MKVKLSLQLYAVCSISGHQIYVIHSIEIHCQGAFEMFSESLRYIEDSQEYCPIYQWFIKQCSRNFKKCSIGGILLLVDSEF